MTITAGLVLFAVIWFMTLLVVLPIRIKTQGDLGEIVPGTHAGAPEVHHMKKKLWITTGITVILWAIIAGIIVSGVISVRDFDWLNNLEPR
ncbi:DUF1467 family protein [uncultured Ruegeria sp.]|uniref:DUF1467 family protein n=1 Tax=uncultured Ruegeria sp. TaxID=259304 RepID=UPI00262AF333|nr:DUF1467 family protein [uncultured Ruegeria sp.]